MAYKETFNTSLKSNDNKKFFSSIKAEKLSYGDAKTNLQRYSFNLSKNKECATQTSKTILQLAEMETDLSPDSLNDSPRMNNIQNIPREDTSNSSTLEREVTSSHEVKRCQNSELPSLSLIGSYLARTKVNATQSCKERSEFLTQTSPLRHIVYAERDDNNFRSRSWAQTYASSCSTDDFTFKTQETTETKQPRVARPNLAQTKKNCAKINFKSILHHLANANNQKRKSTFMMPTIASEQKNQMSKIQSVTSLVTPPRRGRSVSPQKTKPIAYKIPYIDQSQSDTDPSYYMRRKLTKCKPYTNIKVIATTDNKAVKEKEPAKVVLTTSSSSIDSSVAGVMVRVKDSDWNIALRGLAEVLELCRTDPDSIHEQMTVINQRILELLKSPRSHVCRTACQVMGNIFEHIKEIRRPEFDEIVDILLCKTADSNKFIRQDANLALDCMVTHIPFTHAMRALCSKGPNHKNSLVRTATVRLIVCAVVISGTSFLFHTAANEVSRKRVMQNMMKFLLDKCVEARLYGERLYKILSREPNFPLYLKQYFEKSQIVEMRKSLKTLVYRKK